MKVLLEECLKKVKGGEEVLAARSRELADRPSVAEPARRISTEDRLTQLEREGVLKRGTGKLPDGFWELPIPEDSEGLVRKGLEEDRNRNL
jgi:hypothetical protein